MLSDCCLSPFARLSRAAANAAKDRLRRLGLLTEHVDWTGRANVCERCPMRVVVNRITYCGRPFLSMPRRDDAIDGCGCPTVAKAKDPSEHCPIDSAMNAAQHIAGECSCKWCEVSRKTASTAKLAA